MIIAFMKQFNESTARSIPKAYFGRRFCRCFYSKRGYFMLEGREETTRGCIHYYLHEVEAQRLPLLRQKIYESKEQIPFRRICRPCDPRQFQVEISNKHLSSVNHLHEPRYHGLHIFSPLLGERGWGEKMIEPGNEVVQEPPA